ncbi:hypothetical protein DFH09DRAFT_1159904, partial [Mycena vulgaris]
MSTAELRRRLTELDAQIIGQRLVLRELERERSEIQDEIHANAIYPVLALPFEITAEIFVRCLPLSKDWDESESPMARELQETAPLVLLGVCRAWRDIVLAMPTLWSKLHIRFDYFPEDVASEPRLIEDFVDLWLSRAADCPLSISFSLYGFEGTVWEESPFHASRMRDIIHRHSHRIQHLELGMIEWEIRKLDLDSASFPLLQSATFGCVYSPGNDPHPGAVFGNAPQFHNLVLLRSPGGTALSSFSLPWLQLTKFEGQVDNLDLFTQALNLVELKITYFEENGPPASIITHTNLGSLTLVQDGGDSFNNILKYLTLPALQFLDLSDVDDTAYRALKPFLIRSSPPLLSLAVNASDYSFSFWYGCLRRMAGTLENLTLRYPSALALRIVFKSGEKSLSSLPNLRTLTMLDVSGSLDFHELNIFLYEAQRDRRLVSFRLIWSLSQSIDREIYAAARNTIASRFSWQWTPSSAMDIYVGMENMNYAARWLAI